MSPRAAWRLERLGFTQVYDYVAGKADWIAAGLPTVRSSAPPTRAVEVIDRLDEASEARAEEVMEPGPATVRADADVERTIQRLRSRGVGEIIVSTPEGELLGVLRADPP